MKVLHIWAVLCGLVVLLVTRADGRFAVESEDGFMADDEILSDAKRIRPCVCPKCDEMEDVEQEDPVRKWKDSVMDDDDATDEHLADPDPDPLRIRIRTRYPGRFPFGGFRPRFGLGLGLGLPFFDAQHSDVDEDDTQDIEEMLMGLLDAQGSGRRRGGGRRGGGRRGGGRRGGGRRGGGRRGGGRRGGGRGEYDQEEMEDLMQLLDREILHL